MKMQLYFCLKQETLNGYFDNPFLFTFYENLCENIDVDCCFG